MPDLNSFVSRWLYQRLPQISGGGGSASGVLTLSTTSYTTAGTSTEDAWTYSLPANTLSVDGRAIRISVWVTSAANANTKVFGVTFGGTTVATFTAAANGRTLKAEAVVTRTGAATQLAVGQTYDPSGNTGTTTTPAETLSGAVTIKVQLTTATAAGDLTFRKVIVELLN